MTFCLGLQENIRNERTFNSRRGLSIALPEKHGTWPTCNDWWYEVCDMICSFLLCTNSAYWKSFGYSIVGGHTRVPYRFSWNKYQFYHRNYTYKKYGMPELSYALIFCYVLFIYHYMRSIRYYMQWSFHYMRSIHHYLQWYFFICGPFVIICNALFIIP